MNSMKLCYVAGRFRGAKLADVDRNIAIASMFIAPIAEAGAVPVCVHLCEGLRAHDLHQENDGQWWIDATLEVLRRCDAVVAVPGWQASAGSYGEVAEAVRLGIPVYEATFDYEAGGTPVPSHVSEWRLVTQLMGAPKAAWARTSDDTFAGFARGEP